MAENNEKKDHGRMVGIVVQGKRSLEDIADLVEQDKKKVKEILTEDPESTLRKKEMAGLAARAQSGEFMEAEKEEDGMKE